MELTLAHPVVLALVELSTVALALPVGLSALFHHHPELETEAGI